jgi:hypothetical protein
MDFFHEYGGEPLKPSLFELVAQEQLRDLLQPALKYVLSVWLLLSSQCGLQSPDRPIFIGFRTKIPEVLATDSQPARGVLCTNHALCRAALSS